METRRERDPQICNVEISLLFCRYYPRKVEVLKLDLTLFNGNTEGERYSDM